MRHLAETDDDFRNSLWKAFARAEVEWSPSPAPIFNANLQCDEGLRHALIIVDFLRIARHGGAVTRPGPILTTHSQVRDIARIDSIQRVEHLALFIAHRVGAQRGRRLHCYKT